MRRINSLRDAGVCTGEEDLGSGGSLVAGGTSGSLKDHRMLMKTVGESHAAALRTSKEVRWTDRLLREGMG